MMEVQFNPGQLKLARLTRGYTMAQLAEKASLSRESISKYERGFTIPRGESIIKIAKALKFPINFFGKSSQFVSTGPVFFRSQAASTNKLRDMQKARLKFEIENTNYISQYIQLPRLNIPQPLNIEIKDINLEEIKNIAHKVRQLWKLGNGPVKNLTNTMEVNGIIIVETTMKSQKMDAVSTWANGRPFIALTNNGESPMRRRFNLAHELGHLLLHNSVDNIFELNSKVYKNILERQANQFASDLLLPDREFSNFMLSTNMAFFCEAKKYWNVSISALIYKANSLHLLSENQYLYLEKQLSRNGWRIHEPGDNDLPQERPKIFKESLKMLLDAGVTTKQNVEANLALPIDELEATFQTDFSNDDVGSFTTKPHLRIIK